MSEHTPGPWKLFVSEHGFSIEARNGSKVVVERSPMADHKELISNGKLIAAAPDLFHALWELEYALRHQVVSDPALPLASVEHRAIRKAYDDAITALAKVQP